jgi:hypothetical protein
MTALNQWHSTDGRYFASQADRDQHQRTLDEKAARYAPRVERYLAELKASPDAWAEKFLEQGEYSDVHTAVAAARATLEKITGRELGYTDQARLGMTLAMAWNRTRKPNPLVVAKMEQYEAQRAKLAAEASATTPDAA